MSETLRQKAAARTVQPSGNGRGDPAKTGDTAVPIIEVEVGDDPEAVHVKVAWNRVMRFCRALTKGSTAQVKNREGKLLYTYKYRGVDDVVTLAGMAFRHFGVTVMPVEIVTEYKQGGQMKECHATVTYEITSLGEGSFRGVVKAEGMDLGDKSTVKAEQQAFRVFLTTSLALPTYDPTHDTDATPMLRPEPPTPDETRDEILSTGTSVQRLLAIKGELRNDAERAQTFVFAGDREVRLWDLVVETGKARTGAMEKLGDRSASSTEDGA